MADLTAPLKRLVAPQPLISHTLVKPHDAIRSSKGRNRHNVLRAVLVRARRRIGRRESRRAQAIAR